MRRTSREVAVAFAVCENSPVIPSLQNAIREPNAAILIRENGPDAGLRQSLINRKRGYGQVAKTVHASVRSDPNIAFSILKDTVSDVTGEAFGRRKDIGPPLMYVDK